MGHDNGIQTPDPPLPQIGGGGQPTGTGIRAHVRPPGIHQQAVYLASPPVFHEDGVAVPYVDEM